MKKLNIFLILVNLFLMTGLLIHESMMFFSFPILMMIIMNKNINLKKLSIKSFLMTIYKISPSIIVLLF